jgi:predicted DNA-binding antitoxin AbrB/MazE fold protein
MIIEIVYRKGRLPMIKVQVKDSGTKHTIKIVPSSTTSALSSIRKDTSPQKGTQNPQHWHIKNPFSKGK